MFGSVVVVRKRFVVKAHVLGGKAITCLNLAVIILFRDKPKSPPSFSATVPREKFQNALPLLAKNRSYVLLFCAYSLLYGTFITLAIVISFIVQPFNITSSV